MNAQEWAFLIAPNVMIVSVLAYIGIGMWLNHRDRKNTDD